MLKLSIGAHVETLTDRVFSFVLEFWEINCYMVMPLVTLCCSPVSKVWIGATAPGDL